MALTLTRRQLTNDLTEVGGTGPKDCIALLNVWVLISNLWQGTAEGIIISFITFH